jgi:hypothetical protein
VFSDLSAVRCALRCTLLVQCTWWECWCTNISCIFWSSTPRMVRWNSFYWSARWFDRTYVPLLLPISTSQYIFVWTMRNNYVPITSSQDIICELWGRISYMLSLSKSVTYYECTGETHPCC